MPVALPSAAPTVDHQAWADHAAGRADHAPVPSPFPDVPGPSGREGPALSRRAQDRANRELWDAVMANDLLQSQAVLGQGGDPNHIPSDRSSSLLALAVRHQNPELIQSLLNHGANPAWHNGQAGFVNHSVGNTVVRIDAPALADLLLAQGLPLYPEAGQPLNAFLAHAIAAYPSCPNLRAWWLDHQACGWDRTPWPLDPGVSAPALTGWSRPSFAGQELTVTDDPTQQWLAWIDDAVTAKNENLLNGLARSVMGWTQLRQAGRDPREAWDTFVARAWFTSIVRHDDPVRLNWLIDQGWSPARLTTPDGIAWSWEAMRRGATACTAWLTSMPGMAAQMREDAQARPAQTVLRPVSRKGPPVRYAPGDNGYYTFYGWTTGQLTRLHKLGVDVGVQDEQGTLFHRQIRTFDVNTTRDSRLGHDLALRWLVRHRPDLLVVPSPRGQTVLDLGDATYQNGKVWNTAEANAAAEKAWNEVRRSLETAALRVTATETLGPDKGPRHVRSRL